MSRLRIGAPACVSTEAAPLAMATLRNLVDAIRHRGASTEHALLAQALANLADARGVDDKGQERSVLDSQRVVVALETLLQIFKGTAIRNVDEATVAFWELETAVRQIDRVTRVHFVEQWNRVDAVEKPEGVVGGTALLEGVLDDLGDLRDEDVHDKSKLKTLTDELEALRRLHFDFDLRNLPENLGKTILDALDSFRAKGSVSKPLTAKLWEACFAPKQVTDVRFYGRPVLDLMPVHRKLMLLDSLLTGGVVGVDDERAFEFAVQAFKELDRAVGRRLGPPLHRLWMKAMEQPGSDSTVVSDSDDDDRMDD